MNIRKEILDFSNAMETELRKHDKQRGSSWKGIDVGSNWLVNRLYDELVEAREPYSSPNEWADVANFAMFLWWRKVNAVPVGKRGR